MRASAIVILGLLALPLIANDAFGSEPSIVVQSTTSTKNSGLYDHILSQATADTGVVVNVVAVGTGQAIRNARNCDGDVLLIHAKSAEQAFVGSGFGALRADLMYNDFVIVGPSNDPAGIAGTKDAAAALGKIAAAEARFASRGDDSGTHRKESALWEVAGIDPSLGSGKWYLETGSGMGATLNTAVGMGAYAMTDRATWIAFRNKDDFQIAVEDDARLFNQYGVILVSKAKCPNVKAGFAQRFIDWLLSARGQRAIGSFQMNGEQLFFPNARRGG